MGDFRRVLKVWVKTLMPTSSTERNTIAKRFLRIPSRAWHCTSSNSGWLLGFRVRKVDCQCFTLNFTRRGRGDVPTDAAAPGGGAREGSPRHARQHDKPLTLSLEVEDRMSVDYENESIRRIYISSSILTKRHSCHLLVHLRNSHAVVQLKVLQVRQIINHSPDAKDLISGICTLFVSHVVGEI
jgi:hypothetical protein